MTTNQSELVETIISILGVTDRTSGNRPEQIATLEQVIEGYITADRKRVALEARLDEWKSMGDFLTKADKRALSREFLDLYRLHGERLKAEREEV